MLKRQVIILLIFIISLSVFESNVIAASNSLSESEAGHVEIEPVKILIADSATMDLLNTDWLNMVDETHFEEIRPNLSNLFRTFVAVLALAACLSAFLILNDEKNG